jgi:hypothetical protein
MSLLAALDDAIEETENRLNHEGEWQEPEKQAGGSAYAVDETADPDTDAQAPPAFNRCGIRCSKLPQRYGVVLGFTMLSFVDAVLVVKFG